MSKYLKTIIIFLILVAVVTQCVSIFFANSTAIDSLGATKLKAEQDALSENNIQLETKVLQLASYNTIASRAAALGYSDSFEIVSVYDPVQVVLAR